MKTRTETHTWQIFELSENEFRERMQIPDGWHIVSVSVVGGKVTVHMTER